MTRFWNFILGLNSTYSEEERTTTIVASRSMANFIEQRLYSLNFRSDFSRLIIQCSREPADIEFHKGTDPAIATIYINLELGDFLASEESMHKAFSLMLSTGVEKALKHEPLPSSQIMAALDEFNNNGHINQWVHVDKLWKRKDYRCVIECDLRTDAFYLTQKIYKGDILLVEKLIGETLPREWLFHQLLGKLTLKENYIVYANKQKTISTFRIEEGEL